MRARNVAVVVVGDSPDWVTASSHLPVLARHGASPVKPSPQASSFKPRFRRWARNGIPLSEDGAVGLAGALPVDLPCDIFVIAPAGNIDGLTSVARRDALDVAEAVECSRRSATKLRVILVIDGELGDSECREWAALYHADRRSSKAAAAAVFFSRSMIRPRHDGHDFGRKLWAGDVHIPARKSKRGTGETDQQTVLNRGIPGFELVISAAARKRSELRLLDLLPISAKKQDSVPAMLLTVVPPGLAIGGFLNSQKELELHITDACNATTGHFCQGWAESGASLLFRVENLTMLCFWRSRSKSKQSPWICDVVPVYELSTPTVLALDSASYRKYVLGICGRSKVYFPSAALASLPLISLSTDAENGISLFEDSPGTKWIDKNAFEDAIAVISRNKSKDEPAKKGAEGAAQKVLKRRSTSSLREPPSWDEVALVERSVLGRKELCRAATARKRARSGNYSLDNLTEPPLPWTGRSTLSEDFNISTGGYANKEQMATLRQNRQARLQSMQSYKNRAVRQQQNQTRSDIPRRRSQGTNIFSNRDNLLRSTASNSISSHSRARSLGSHQWHDLVAKIQDTTILPKLERLDNFFEHATLCSRMKSEHECTALQLQGLRVGLEREECGKGQSKSLLAMRHGVEYARDSMGVRDALLTKYGLEVGRSAQEHATAWGTVGVKDSLRKLKAGLKSLQEMHGSRRNAEEPIELLDTPAIPIPVDSDDEDALIGLWARCRASRASANCDAHLRDTALSVDGAATSERLEDSAEISAKLARLERQREEIDEEIRKLRTRLRSQ